MGDVAADSGERVTVVLMRPGELTCEEVTLAMEVVEADMLLSNASCTGAKDMKGGTEPPARWVTLTRVPVRGVVPPPWLVTRTTLVAGVKDVRLVVTGRGEDSGEDGGVMV